MRKVLVGLALLVPSIVVAVMPPPKSKKDPIPHFFQPENWWPAPEQKGRAFSLTNKPVVSQPVMLPFANVKVSDDILGRPQHEPHLAVYGSKVYALFKDWRTGSRQRVFFARSLDSGNSWQPNYQIIEPTTLLNSDPVIKVHPNSDPFACILGRGVFVARSIDQGSSFDTARKASLQPPTDGIDKQWMEIGPSGNIYVAWNAIIDFGPVTDIRLARSTDEGTTWSSWLRLNDNPPFDSTSFRIGVQIVEGPDGILHALWGWDDRDGIPGIYKTTSTDSGRSFGSNRLVAHQVLNDSMPWRTGLLPSAAVDRTNGNVYVTWYDSRFRPGFTDIAFARSTDDGATWDSVIFVNVTTIGDRTQQFMPAIAVDPFGRVFLIWYDTRTRVSGGNTVDVFYSYSEDFGQTWAAETRITTVGSVPVLDSYSNAVMGDYNGLVADGRALYAVWGDSRNGNQDIYFARIPTPSPLCMNVKGDMDGNGIYSVVDVVHLINCTFLDLGFCDICYTDVNCDGIPTPADVVLELNRVFLDVPFPCQ